MKKNILRVISLLLIVCVLAGFPLKAKATEVAAYAALSVGAQNLIAGLFNACGLGPGGDPQPFYDAVNQCISDLHLGEIIQGVTWAFSGFQRFAVPVTLAEQVRDWLWDSGTVYEGTPSEITSSASGIVNGTTWDVSCNGGFIGLFYARCGYDNNTSFIHRVFAMSTHELISVNGYSRTALINDNGVYIYLLNSATVQSSDWSYNTSGITDLGSYYADSFNDASLLLTNLSWNIPVVPEGFSSGTIVSRYNPIIDDFPTWGEGIISVDPSIVDSDETEAIPYIPVGVGQTLEESAALTQEQAQSGVSTIEVSVEIPDDTVAGTKLSAFFSSLLSALSWTSIKTWIEGIWTSVLSIPDAIANLHSLVLSIPQAIADVLADVFIPAEDYISVKVEALAVEYAFVPDIVNSVTLLKNNLVGDGGPPVIYVDFGRAGGSTNYGGKVLLTDFAWYEEYKPTVDALLSAALWAFFLWRVFLKMPGIIGGESAAVGSAFTSYTRRGRDE